jgi:murein DD-endopeptidase MepM/ murein hydrolase activator NlpD
MIPRLFAACLVLALPVGTAFADPLASHAKWASGAAVVEAGDTLEGILAEADIAATDRAEAALALAGVFDVSDLRPGHRVGWTTETGDASQLRRLTLSIADGVQIHLSFADTVSVALREPEITTHDRREVLTLDRALYDALIAKNAPERFAVDLTALLAGQVDFRLDLMGGETFALVWQEDRLPSGEVVGEPRLDYARLELGGRTLELVVSSVTGPVLVFEDGEVVQRSAPPILGARLSSVFGKRNHPVLGGVRMHTGIDFAAPVGTEVNATGSGRVVFAGTIRGYGLTVDIDHGGGVVTRYAHLSEIADGVAPGRRLKAGDTLGAVGATGLVSGPNLHYEVRLDGAPVNPMDQNALPEEIIASAEDIDALSRWRNATGYTNARKEG